MSAILEMTGTTADQWRALEEIVASTFQAVAQVRAVIPAGPAATDRYHVTMPEIKNGVDCVELNMETCIPPTRLRACFCIGSDQLGDFDVLTILARNAAQRLAGAESATFLMGEQTAAPNTEFISWLVNKGVKVDDFGCSRAIPSYDTAAVANADVSTLLAKGVTELHGDGHFGPYALVMPTEFAKEYGTARCDGKTGPALATLLGTGLRTALVPFDTGPYLAQGGSRGYLISLGSQAIDLIQVDPLSLSFSGFDSGGGVKLCVEERIALRVIDPTAMVDLVLV